MNEFTKDELQMLSHGVLLAVLPDTQERYAPLYNKIRSMIDNYCDHHLINYCCGCDPENIVCDKCHRDLWGKSVE